MDSLEAENSFLARTELSVLGSVIPNVARKKWGTCENLIIQSHPSHHQDGGEKSQGLETEFFRTKSVNIC